MITTFIYIIGVAWFITQLEEILDTFNEMTKGFKEAGNTLLGKLQCMRCVSFWIALAVTANFPLGCVVSMVAHLIDTHLLIKGFKL